ncbi:MAG: hypothetical protein K2M76_02320, partial [Muribaculaceae bacterium]|nr:hypothetical protein [Muribaculaceae bacterium]
MQQLVLLDKSEQGLRIAKVLAQIPASTSGKHPDGILITENSSLFYLTGRVYAGFMYIHADGNVQYFVRRPVELAGNDIAYIHKPEDMG